MSQSVSQLKSVACPTCGRTVTITKSGRLRVHKRPPRRDTEYFAWLNHVNVRCEGRRYG
jgi:hypothetical protein